MKHPLLPLIATTLLVACINLHDKPAPLVSVEHHQKSADTSATPVPGSKDGSFNSGILEFLPNGSYHVTPHYIERWDALILKYGHTFTPPLPSHDRTGITKQPDGTYYMDQQAHHKFTTMNQMLWDAIHPRSK